MGALGLSPVERQSQAFLQAAQAAIAAEPEAGRIRLRAKDSARPLWWAVDWFLRAFANQCVHRDGGRGQAIFIVGDGGLTALFAEVWEPCGIAGASLFALTRWLRRVRGIELATSDRRGVDE
jgi:hypothetical protein